MSPIQNMPRMPGMPCYHQNPWVFWSWLVVSYQGGGQGSEGLENHHLVAPVACGTSQKSSFQDTFDNKDLKPFGWFPVMLLLQEIGFALKIPWIQDLKISNPLSFGHFGGKQWNRVPNANQVILFEF